MGRAQPCGTCEQEEKCTQWGPFNTWVEDDWDVEIVPRDDPASSASITGWGSSDLEITTTIGTSTVSVSVGTNVGADRGIDVYLRPKLHYRHYRHWKHPTLLTARCELELPARPGTFTGALAPAVIMNAKHNLTTFASVIWGNLYQERHVRRGAQSITPPAPPTCPPAWDDGYTFEVRLAFPGGWCNQGQSWTTRIGALEWRLGSNCVSYLAPSPGNDALHGATSWSDLTDLSGFCARPGCGSCTANPTVNVAGDMLLDTSSLGLGIPFVEWPYLECPAWPEGFETNAAGFYSMLMAWDADLADWAIHHRGHHYLADNPVRLTAGGLTLTAAPYRWIPAGAFAQPEFCEYPDPYRCAEGDVCGNFPAAFPVSLVAL